MSTATERSAAPRRADDEMAGGLVYPTRRNEAWRYAPHATLARLTFGPDVADGELPDGFLEGLPLADGPRVVILNGRVDRGRSNLAALPAGVTLVAPLGSSSDDETRLAGRFALLEASEDAYAVLNSLHAHDAVVLRVEPGTEVAEPFHVVDVVAPGGAPHSPCSRVEIEVGEGAAAVVVETHVGVGDDFGGSNFRTTVSLGARARMEHIVIQDLPPNQVLLGRIDVSQDVASELRARAFNLGGSYGRIDHRVDLAGEGARAELSGLYFGRGEQVLDQQVTVVHRVGDCTSRQEFRGVLDDRSTGVFSGGIEVLPGADGTDAAQSNDNLLLSRQAEVDTQPRLEILADDVACTHGATVGQLDQTALYYLRSRGIPADEASRLLINGFADRVVDHVSIPAVRTWVADRLGHTDG